MRGTTFLNRVVGDTATRIFGSLHVINWLPNCFTVCKRISAALLLFLMSSCASRTPLSTPVPFVVQGRVITRSKQPVPRAHIYLTEEHSRLIPFALAASRPLGDAITSADGSFEITVGTPLTSQRLMLLVVGRTYTLANQYTESNDSVYTESVRVPGPNVIRVRSGFIPGPGRVTVQRLPRF